MWHVGHWCSVLVIRWCTGSDAYKRHAYICECACTYFVVAVHDPAYLCIVLKVWNRSSKLRMCVLIFKWNIPVVVQSNICIAKHCHAECTLKNIQATSFSFSIKSSSVLFDMQIHTKNLYLHVGLRSHSLTICVIKTSVKIHRSCVKL